MVRSAQILVWLVAVSLLPQAFAQTDSRPAGNTIAFASDTQAPMWIESVFLKDRQNRRATGLVFDEIIRTHPLGLFIFGDVVSLGHSDKAWKTVDVYLKNMRDAGIPVYATLGNHELMQKPGKGMANFQRRFPEHKPTGYLQVVDSVAIIMLNSNFGSLTKAQIEKQQQWLKDTLNALDSNKAILAIIMGCHHPPYTNSKLVKSSTPVQEQFVKPFLASRKAKLFITGHSHAFEYFKTGGKDFLIIGGGGGLHHPLNTGKDKLDDQSLMYKPFFHYLTVSIRPHELYVLSHQLREDFTGFEDGFSVKIPLK